MVDLGSIIRQAQWDEMAIEALMDGYGLTDREARKRYDTRSAKLDNGVLSFQYWDGGQLLRGELETQQKDGVLARGVAE